MAQKSYGAVTLNGNWHEERSAPLNGVIASYHTANVSEWVSGWLFKLTLNWRIILRRTKVPLRSLQIFHRESNQ